MSTTYSEKLKDPRWQKLRLQVFERDGFTCRFCGDTETTLHVHHREYMGKHPWDTPIECLDTICEDCHSAIYKMNELEFFLYEALCNRDRQAGMGVEWMKMLNRIVKDKKNGK